jgi:hypothetical protein
MFRAASKRAERCSKWNAVSARLLDDDPTRFACPSMSSKAADRYVTAFVEGMDLRDSRVHNFPSRWNGAPSQDLLGIRRNHDTGHVSLDPLRWGLIPYWCKDPKGGRLRAVGRNTRSDAAHSRARRLHPLAERRTDPRDLMRGKYQKTPPSSSAFRGRRWVDCES